MAISMRRAGRMEMEPGLTIARVANLVHPPAGDVEDITGTDVMFPPTRFHGDLALNYLNPLVLSDVRVTGYPAARGETKLGGEQFAAGAPPRGDEGQGLAEQWIVSLPTVYLPPSWSCRG